MNKIIITIPDGLSDKEEVIAIAKKMEQKRLSGSGVNKEQLKIGTEITVKNVDTAIIVKRVNKEPIIQMITCNVCGCEYQNNTASYYYHNYGGNKKKVAVCSVDCRDSIVSFLGCRASVSKSKLKHFINI